MKPRENLTADIPPSLRWADELLHRYGRWARDKPRQYRCGSAEGAYLPGKGEAQEARRVPREVLMSDSEALGVNRALRRLPERTRFILAVIYVPQKLPMQVLFRVHHISAREAREGHLSGVRMFADALEWVMA